MCTEVGYGMFFFEAKERIIKSKAKQVIMLPPPVDNWRYPIADFMKHLVWLFSDTGIGNSNSTRLKRIDVSKP